MMQSAVRFSQRRRAAIGSRMRALAGGGVHLALLVCTWKREKRESREGVGSGRSGRCRRAARRTAGDEWQAWHAWRMAHAAKHKARWWASPFEARD